MSFCAAERISPGTGRKILSSRIAGLSAMRNHSPIAKAANGRARLSRAGSNVARRTARVRRLPDDLVDHRQKWVDVEGLCQVVAGAGGQQSLDLAGRCVGT